MEDVKSPGGQSNSKLLNHFLRLTLVVLGILWLFWCVWKRGVTIPPLTCASNHQELWSLQRLKCIPSDERHLMVIVFLVYTFPNIFFCIFPWSFVSLCGSFPLSLYVEFTIASNQSLKSKRLWIHFLWKWSGVGGDEWVFTRSLIFLHSTLHLVHPSSLLCLAVAHLITSRQSVLFTGTSVQWTPGKIVEMLGTAS